MATHVKVIGVFFVICGVFLIAGAFFLPAILGLVAALIGSSGDPDAGVATTVIGVTGVALSIMLAALAIPYLAAGWGLLKLRPWARILGIVLGVLSLVEFPFGTALGIYALVILFRKDTEALFAATA